MASALPSFTQFAPSTPDLPQDAAPAERKRGLLGCFLDALIEARQREAEQQVARLLARSGGTFTDSLEREAERREL